MTRTVDVREILDRRAAHMASLGQGQAALELRDAKEAVAELIEADEEYDAAVTAHKELVRRIAEQGWYEIQTDALRNAGVRTDRAQARRAAALAGVGGAK